ncbi:MAG: ribokinase [Verrucomicrobiota bacterium]
MRSMRKPLVVLGSANMDLVTRMNVFPQPGETRPGSALEQHPGGKGANQAVAAARAGTKVGFIGNIGHGSFGDTLVSGLAKEGIDLTHLRRSKELPAGTALILLNRAGENQIVVTRSSNELVSAAQVRQAKPLIQQAGLLLVQLEVPLAAVTTAISLAHKAKVPVMLNPAPISRPLPKRLLAQVTWLTPNEHELAVLTGVTARTKEQLEQGAQKLLSAGVPNIVVTCGARGACWVSANTTRWFPARKVKVVDTVGAGDCFSGVLAAGLTRGLPPEAAIRKAVQAATLNVTKLGARS